MTLLFTGRDDKTLVDEIAKYPGLWVLTHRERQNQALKEKAWDDIATKVGKSVDICKKRWKNIRDTFDRRKHRKKNPDSQSKRTKRWLLEEKLSFLKFTEQFEESAFRIPSPPREIDDSSVSFVETIVTPSSIVNSSLWPDPDTLTPQAQPITAQKPRKRQKQKDSLLRKKIPKTKKSKHAQLIETILTAGEPEEDDIDLFFKSMAKSVKKMRPDLRQRAKIETLSLINKLENEMLKSANLSNITSEQQQNKLPLTSEIATAAAVSNAFSTIFSAALHQNNTHP